MMPRKTTAYGIPGRLRRRGILSETGFATPFGFDGVGTLLGATRHRGARRPNTGHFWTSSSGRLAQGVQTT